MSAETIHLDPACIEKLLEKLSTDNAFRKLFKKSPLDALASIGCKPPEGCPVPPCLTVHKIAPKEEIIRALQELRAYLTSHASQTNPHCFEAGKILGTIGKK
ncbi:NHLP-related RiPP peptide [Xanthomonas sp. PPL568]|uniref:NHLP-related RiPP peptide n=1 Tax=Xanthomonas indica TaxID=2912242 RepID=UPI001F5A525B|nr:NHLP-related RiPP peptide [Xanthomonas indica]MCI2244439.1 NHLP-related RiPP peptide [Xanthomonas indica]